MDRQGRLNYTLRMKPETMEKFRYVCKYEGRSVQGKLDFYINRSIENFEAKHGEIPLPPADKSGS